MYFRAFFEWKMFIVIFENIENPNLSWFYQKILLFSWNAWLRYSFFFRRNLKKKKLSSFFNETLDSIVLCERRTLSNTVVQKSIMKIPINNKQ